MYKIHVKHEQCKKEKPWWDHVYMISPKVSLFYNAKHVSSDLHKQIGTCIAWIQKKRKRGVLYSRRTRSHSVRRTMGHKLFFR